MNEDTTETTDVSETAADADSSNVVDGADESAQAGSAAEGSSASDDAGDDPAYALAAEALEGLTETVGMLGGAAGDDARARLAELAGELASVSEQLAVAVGGAGASDEPAGGEDTDKGSDAEDALTTTISAVRATLQQVGNLLQARTKDGAKPEPPKSEPPKPEAEDNASSKLGAQLEALTTELRMLNTTVKEQQQRLARLEKRFGLPNSRTAGERPSRAGSDDVGWPLDMNRSFDREAVDKSTSFHDV